MPTLGMLAVVFEAILYIYAGPVGEGMAILIAMLLFLSVERIRAMMAIAVSTAIVCLIRTSASVGIVDIN